MKNLNPQLNRKVSQETFLAIKIIIAFIWPFSFLSESFAEYRVFELLIYEEVPNEDPATSAQIKFTEEIKRTLVSNLDPLQYPRYYHLNTKEKIKYINTWMCYESTSNKDFCPNPKLQNNSSDSPTTQAP